MRKLSLILLIIVLIPVLALAEILTIEDAVNAGLERSLAIESELLQYRNQQTMQLQNMYSWLPRANLNLGKSLYDGDWTDMQGQMSFSWDITSNDSRYFEMRRQLLEMHNASLSLDDKKKNIAWQVLSRYIDVLQASDLISVQSDVLLLEEKKHASAIAEFELGETARSEMDQVEISKLQAEISLNQLEISYQEKRRELFYYINMEDDQQELEGLTMELNITQQPYRANLKYQMTEDELEKMRISRKEDELMLFPIFSLGYSYDQSSTEGVFEFDEYNDSSSLSLQLSYSVFDIFRNRENLKTSGRQLDYYEKQRADQELLDRITLENYNNRLSIQNRNYELNQRKTELALQVLEQAQMEYSQGELSLLDLNEFQNRYFNSRNNEIKGYYDVIQTQENINLHLSGDILGKW